MSIISFIIVCVVVGVTLWVINAYVPMEPNIKRVLNVGVLILLVLWILFTVLGMANLGSVRIGVD